MSAKKVVSIPDLVRQWDIGHAPPGGPAAEAGREYTDGPREFLLTALQSAITLEFATIPPYLCALWSVKDELHPIAASLREIVQEEMLHMAIACNMLAAIGGKVKITADGFVPSYPGNLPGGVHPDLEVILGGLSKETLKKFLTIECPAEFPQNVEFDKDYDVREPDHSIGRFYDCIDEAFQKLPPEHRNLSVDRQITGPRSWIVISKVEHVKRAVGIIKSQGEGAESGPYDSSNKDLAHYFRFQEVHRRQKLIKKRDGTFKYVGNFGEPKVWPMKATPMGGYQKGDVSDKVWRWLHGFDVAYSEVLRALESAWNGGGQGMLVLSIQKMFELEKFAKPLMRTPIDGDREKMTYGPCFRYIPLERHADGGSS
jgi:hypothetical protein